MNTALEALREITRGVFPAQLARSGLPTALGSLLARTGGTGRLVVERRRPRQTLRPARRGRGVLLRRRGDARPRRPGRRDADGGRRSAAAGRQRRRTGAASSRDDIRDRVEAAGGTVSITIDGRLTRRRGSAARPHLVQPIRAERRLGDVGRGPGLGDEGRRRRRRRTSRAAARRVQASASQQPPVASSPSMPGRFTSISTRSGSSCGRDLERTPRPRSPDRRPRNPESPRPPTVMARRKVLWSSTSSTRTTATSGSPPELSLAVGLAGREGASRT